MTWDSIANISAHISSSFSFYVTISLLTSQNIFLKKQSTNMKYSTWDENKI